MLCGEIFLPCYILYPRYSNSPYSQGAEGHAVTLLLLPQCTGSRAGAQVLSQGDCWWPGCGRTRFTPYSQQSRDNRVLGLGSSHWSLGFAGDIALCSAESLFLDVKLLQRKGRNLTKLTHSAPQNSTFQALVICKPSHGSSAVHEGTDSFPVKVPNNNHKPKKPLHGYESQWDQPGYFHCLCRTRGKRHFDYQSSSLRSQSGTGRGIFSSTGWPGKHN